MREKPEDEAKLERLTVLYRLEERLEVAGQDLRVEAFHRGRTSYTFNLAVRR